jgi:hypothetical protein
VRLATCALVIVAGCGAQAAERLHVPPLVPGTPIPWARVRVENKEDAEKVWTALDPHGRDYADRLAEMPRRYWPWMAKTLLDDGGFACKPVAATCGVGTVIPEPDADAGIGDPCLRRKLAIWAVGVVQPTEIIDLVRIPMPEQALHAAVLAAVEDPSLRAAMTLEVEKTGDETTADAYVDGLDRGQLDKLALAGVDGAIEALLAADPGPDRLKAIVATTGHVRRETWLDVVREAERERALYDEVSRRTIDDAIAQLVATGDCQIGGIAGLSDSAYRQSAQSIENWNYMACFWLSAQGPASIFLRKDLIDAKLHVLPADEIRATDGSFEMPFADELPGALEGCSADDCAAPGSATHFRLKLGPNGKLQEIERYEAALSIGGC